MREAAAPFVPLTTFLRPVAEAPALDAPAAAPEPEPERATPAPPACDDDVLAEHVQTLQAVRRFRAGVADALDAAVDTLLEAIAHTVLARELRLGETDVAAIVARARERFLRDDVLVVRLHPHDGHALEQLQIQVRFDERLTPGDVVLELQSGTIDLRMKSRLEIALRACRP